MNSSTKISFLLVAAIYLTVSDVGAISGKDISSIVNPLALIKSIRPIKISKTASVADPPCDATLFATCVANLAKDLDLPQIPQQAEALFLYLMTTIINNGLQGFESICKATTNFEGCLGASFDTCMSVQSLIYAGLDENDATVYATLAQEMKYECGPAYQIFVDNFQCAYAATKRGIGKIIDCIQIFNSTEPTNVCNQVQQFTQCYTDIFKDCGSDFTRAMCETMKAGYEVSLPQCDVKCPRQTQILKQLLQLRYKK